MSNVQREVYLLDRNPEESARLNDQHAFLVDLIGGLIHPSIPIEGIQAVADLATGTGIWLRDMASLLTSRNPSPSHPYYLHGFDISSNQFQSFPSQSNAEVHLSVRNCLQPFPSEHHGRYDVVHLQLLIVALRLNEYGVILKNVFDLLKPGGYLQWTECDVTAFDTEQSPPPLLFTEKTRILNSAIAKFNLCNTPPEHIEHEAQRTGFVGVQREKFDTRSKPYLTDAVRVWLAQVSRLLLPSIMIRTGEVEEEAVAKQYIEGLVTDFQKHCANVLPLANIQVIVARRPLSPSQ